MQSRQPAMASRPMSAVVFFGFAAVLFATAVAVTVAGCASMSAMPGMSAWLPASGRTWPGTAAVFLGMWTAMMVAMMLPSLVPMLWRWRLTASAAGARQPDRLVLWIGAGYVATWVLLGMGVFALGTSLALLTGRWPLPAHTMTLAGGVAVLAAGLLQFTAWKSRHLACCRRIPGCAGPPLIAAHSAWQYGLRLGLHCVQCCAGPTAVLLALGIMDLRAMAAVTTAITAERLMPAGGRVARFTGALAVGAGLLLVARASELG